MSQISFIYILILSFSSCYLRYFCISRIQRISVNFLARVYLLGSTSWFLFWKFVWSDSRQCDRNIKSNCLIAMWSVKCWFCKYNSDTVLASSCFTFDSLFLSPIVSARGRRWIFSLDQSNFDKACLSKVWCLGLTRSRGKTTSWPLRFLWLPVRWRWEIPSSAVCFRYLLLRS